MNKILNALKKYFLNPVIEIFKEYNIPEYRYLAFLLIPIVYFINSTIVHMAFGRFYLHSVDPEYFHMFNGLAIAKGNLSVQCIAHPGTPLEFLFAFAARILNISRSNDYMYRDFVNDPERYIHATIFLQNLITAIIIYWGAIKVNRYSKSIAVTIGFHLIPFANFYLLQISGRIIPESTMVIPMLLIVILLIKHLYSDKAVINSDLVKWAMIMGLGVACKLSFIPVIVFPVFLLRTSFKQKILYGIYTLIAIAIFAYPIVINFQMFWDWVSKMATHSGKYGGGANNVIDISSVLPHMKFMFHEEMTFFILIIITSGFLIISFFKSKINNPARIQNILRSILALNITIVIALLFTLKHYEFHYFFPYFTFKYVLLIFIFILISTINSLKILNRIVAAIFIIVLLFISINQFHKLEVTVNTIKENSEKNETNAANFTRLVDPNTPIIISGAYYGSPFTAFAQSEGLNLSYRQKVGFKKFLQQKYPNTYMFYDWAELFYFFDDYVSIHEILNNANSSSFYVYLGEGKLNNGLLIEDKIFNDLKDSSISKDTLLYNQETTELLIKYSVHNE